MEGVDEMWRKFLSRSRSAAYSWILGHGAPLRVDTCQGRHATPTSDSPGMTQPFSQHKSDSSCKKHSACPPERETRRVILGRSIRLRYNTDSQVNKHLPAKKQLTFRRRESVTEDPDNTRLRRGFIFALMLCTTISGIFAQPTAKTFFHQSSCPAWCDPLVHQTGGSVSVPQSSLRSTFHIEPFYWRSHEKTKLGKYFGYKDDSNIVRNEISVDTNSATALFPQQLIHDSANSDDFTNPELNPLEAIIQFWPFIEQYGVLVTNSTHITDRVSIHTSMPWIHQTNTLGMTTTKSTPQLVEGASKTVADFFAGSVEQVAAGSPDQQDALVYGKFTNKQSRTGLGDITLMVVGELARDEQLTFNIGALLTVPTNGRPTGHYLFEPTLGTGGHVVLGAHADALIRLGTLKTISFHGVLYASYRVGISAHEVRSAGFQTSTGTDLQFGRYALAGKQHARRLFPFINMLTQPVDVSPGNATDVCVGLHAQYRWLRTRVLYRYTHTAAEKVTPLVQWPESAYGESSLSYEQVDDSDNYFTFNTATDSILSTASLKSENILFSSAETPAQQTHAILVTFTGTPFTSLPNSSFTLRGQYAFTSGTTFGLGGAGISAAFSHTF